MAFLSMLLVFATVAVLSLALARLGLVLTLSLAGQAHKTNSLRH